jgi:hypothetical protein
MGLKGILAVVFLLFAIGIMVFYFVPFNTTYFRANSGNDNFSIIQGNESMQFYPNMRFPENIISYRISNCSLQKEDDMEYAFNLIENITPLRFYSVTEDEEIFITCEERNRVNKGLFIAGEGGPTNITVAGQLSVITAGEILLIRESDCPKPNIAMHELMHVLGFKHSANPENIMYEITDCEQTIGQDLLDKITELYSIPSYPDLAFGDVSASMTGRMLDMNMTVMNAGLSNSGDSKISIYAENNLIKEIQLEPIKIGYARIITIRNTFVAQLSVSELNVIIESDLNEINKENNKIKLEIK